jgi:hypothetical protein
MKKVFWVIVPVILFLATVLQFTNPPAILWFRCPNVFVKDAQGRSFETPCYLGRNGRLFIKCKVQPLVTDANRRTIGGAQAIWYWTTPWFVWVSKTDPSIVDLSKTDMAECEFHSSLFESGKIIGIGRLD